MEAVLKRGRGRPKGSKNKVKVAVEEVKVDKPVEETKCCDQACEKKEEGKQEQL